MKKRKKRQSGSMSNLAGGSRLRGTYFLKRGPPLDCFSHPRKNPSMRQEDAEKRVTIYLAPLFYYTPIFFFIC